MRKYLKIKKIIFLLSILLPNTTQASKIENVKVYTTDRIIPLVSITNNQLSGVSGEFLVQSTKDIINHLEIVILPWARAQIDVQNEKNAIIIPLTRTLPREKNYKWIAKVFDDKVCFFTLKKNKPINDKKDLLSLKRIGIIRGGAEEIILKDLNLTKSIDESNTHQSLIQKLFAERLDAILLGSLTANLLWHNNGYPQDQLQCGRPYTYNSQFIAASLSSDNEFIKTISIAMENFKKTPDYINILQKYEIKDINKIKTIQEEIKK